MVAYRSWFYDMAGSPWTIGGCDGLERQQIWFLGRGNPSSTRPTYAGTLHLNPNCFMFAARRNNRELADSFILVHRGDGAHIDQAR